MFIKGRVLDMTKKGQSKSLANEHILLRREALKFFIYHLKETVQSVVSDWPGIKLTERPAVKSDWQ